ncbi:lipopolysaccharide biosynthesis protein [Cognatitamlana onchidii]|uniref:lipopolysaccharide biosynthesis protein n=1 Tax=Cognatitamlana onchidii TaxID=2562860 RepID=UPI0010A6A18A|nr:polysaccharide biosynthesis C-terminal domain-containing protein [Algibacter onchidii]
MGVVASQSFKNIVSTYLGFAMGAINTLFLYTEFLSDAYYGMVGYMLSLAYVLMPIMSFGVHNTLVKFYSAFKTRTSLNSFLTLMLFLPLAVIIPLIAITYISSDVIVGFLAQKNDIIGGYLWHTIFAAIALAYFEVFFAWVKVQMQTVFGNFMKEVFHRAATMILLFLLYLEVIDVDQFMLGLVIVYLLRTLIMKVYAFSIKLPIITFKSLNNLTAILKYSFLIIIAASVATILLDVDKVMLGYYVEIEQIAYYNVAIFIAAVIAVPQRSMHQILMPLSAKYLNERDFDSLEDLYKRSSLNLLIVGGLIFLLILTNINQLYFLIPEQFGGGLFVVFVIGLSKLFDAALGSNNAILFNSDYYRMVLALGVFLAVLMILLNIVFIPWLGINGASLATLFAVFLYNSIKLYVVYNKLKIFPFTIKTLKVVVLIWASVLALYFWEFPFNPLVNIVLKSLLGSLIYLFAVYRFNFSEDLSFLAKKYFKLK